MRRMYWQTAPPLMCICILASSGCGVVRDFATEQARRLLANPLLNLDKKLQDQYGIDPIKDSLTAGVAKMIAVEGKDNPTLMTRLVQNPPSSWGDLKEVATEAIAIARDGDKRAAELNSDKDTLVKTGVGLAGVIAVKLAAYFGLIRPRQKKKESELVDEKAKTEHLYTHIETEGSDKLKKKISKDGAPETIAGIALDVAKRNGNGAAAA